MSAGGYVGDGDRAAGGDREAGDEFFWCARPGSGADALGSYDGVAAWALYVGSVRSVEEQAMTSLHERLHHELQHTTPWGLLTRTAADLSRRGIRPAQLARLARFCRDAARTVHETYATTLSIGDNVEYQVFLASSPDHRDFYDRGRRLVAADFDQGRFLLDALLRACMAASELLELLERGFYRARVIDFDAPSIRPDERFATLGDIDLGPVAAKSPTSSTVDDLAEYYSEVADFLTRHGLPTLNNAGVRQAIAAVLATVEHLHPELHARMEIDPVREPLADDLKEHQREQIVLPRTAPLVLDASSAEEFNGTAADLLSHHDELGPHAVLVWARADLLAAQYRRPNELEQLDGHVLSVQALRRSDQRVGGGDGKPVVRALLLDGAAGPDAFAAHASIPTVVITTARSLFDAPGTATSQHVENIYAVVDAPVLGQLRHTFGKEVSIRWELFRIKKTLDLSLVAFRVTALPGIVWLHLTSEAGKHYLVRWLQAQPADRAVYGRGELADQAAHIDAALNHILGTWSVLDQIAGALHV